MLNFRSRPCKLSVSIIQRHIFGGTSISYFKCEQQQKLIGSQSNMEISFTFFQKIFYQDNAKVFEDYSVYSIALFIMSCLEVN